MEPQQPRYLKTRRREKDTVISVKATDLNLQTFNFEVKSVMVSVITSIHRTHWLTRVTYLMSPRIVRDHVSKKKKKRYGD